jgi:DNA phosphorothioation-dependent restriction protein DptG
MTQYAGFWRRFVAWLIDAVLLGLVGVILNIIFQAEVSGPVSTIIGWVYFAGMESSTRQATLGKQAMNIFVTDLNGQRLSFLRATGRYFAKFLSAIILLIGFFMAAFTARKQALHDMIASTLVLTRG